MRDSFLQETSCCILRKDGSNKAGVLLVIFFPSPSIAPRMMFSVTENTQEQQEIFSLVMLLRSKGWEANWNLEEAKVLGNFGREMKLKRRQEKAAVGTTLWGAKSEVVYRKIRCRAGEPATGGSEVQSSTSRSYLLFPVPTLPLTHCPEYLSLYWLCLPPCLQPLVAHSLFSASFCLFAPAPRPQRARQPVSGAGWRGASRDGGVLKIAEAFWSPPGHLGAAGEP